MSSQTEEMLSQFTQFIKGEHIDYNNDQIILNIDGDATHYYGRYTAYHAKCYIAMLDRYLSSPIFTQTLERV